jgi:hypothetical protein
MLSDDLDTALLFWYKPAVASADCLMWVWEGTKEETFPDCQL